MAGLTTWHDVHIIGRRICKDYRLPWPVIFEPLTGTVGCRSYNGTTLVFGRCDRQPGITPTIKLRLHQAGRPNRPLARATIFAILAHELAHLKDHNHSRKHAVLTRNIALYLEQRGYPVARNALLVKEV
jgi:hypothetical protein